MPLGHVHRRSIALLHQLHRSLRPRPLLLQHLPIPLLLLLLRTLQLLTLVRLQHPMLRTELALTEPAIPHYWLRLLLALLEAAFGLLRGAAADGHDDV